MFNFHYQICLLCGQKNYNLRHETFQDSDEKSPSSPLSPAHEMQKLREQLEQQALQTREALSQLMLVREQLITETNARIEAQVRGCELIKLSKKGKNITDSHTHRLVPNNFYNKIVNCWNIWHRWVVITKMIEPD